MGKEDDTESRPICRDYLRNICSRGENCRYVHPEKKLVFCHDYQNGKCKRNDCVFIHCSREDEYHYDQYGQLPPHLTELPQVNNHIAGSELRDIPICKDFQKGECNRTVCKFRHVHPVLPQPQPMLQPTATTFVTTLQGGPGLRRSWTTDEDGYDDHFRKRTRYGNGAAPDETQPQQYTGNPHPVWTLEDENAILRKTVAELRKRVDDLQATNEFLLEQNAQMRLGEKSAGITAMTVPTVTITNAPPIPQAALRSVTASVATVPVSIAAVAATPVSLATVSMAAGTMQLTAAAPSVTMAQQQPQEAAGGPGQATLLSQQTASIVSYPIVARPVIPASLTH